MDFVEGMVRGIMARQNGDTVLKVFDWEDAAKRIKARNPDSVSAGLSGDWEWTGGLIYKDGKPVPQEDTYVYLASIWATPQIEIDGDRQPCFVLQDKRPDWNSSTYWPKEALDILKTTRRRSK